MKVTLLRGKKPPIVWELKSKWFAYDKANALAMLHSVEVQEVSPTELLVDASSWYTR